MQKKLIALAIAGLASSAAFAQSNVTIYGIVDAFYANASGEDATGADTKFGGIQAGGLAGSRLGFKGEEALGGGLKAVYTLEYSINNDIDAGVGAGGALAGRQQFVGLANDRWGSLTLGRQYAPGYFSSARNDAAMGTLFSPQAILATYAASTFQPGSNARISNSVAYNSPTWSGFKFSAIYGFGENVSSTTDRGDDGFLGLGLNYANGPLNLDLAYQSRQERTQTAPLAGRDDADEWFVGGTYDFKVAKLYASYQAMEDDRVANGTSDFDIWNLGVSMPISTNGSAHISYGRFEWDQGNAESDSWNIEIGRAHV